MDRLGRVFAETPAHLVERFGARIPRLDLVIVERPAGGRAFGVLNRSEILRAVADQHRAIHLGVAADVIVIAGIERLAGGVEPGLLRPEHAALVDRPIVAGFRPVEQPLAALEDDDAGPRRGEPGGQGSAAHAGADDDDVGIVSAVIGGLNVSAALIRPLRGHLLPLAEKAAFRSA